MSINIRKVTINDLRIISNIHVDTWRNSYKGILSNNFLANLSYDKQLEKWLNRLIYNNNNNEFMYLIEYNSEIVGFSSANITDSYDGYINTIYIKNEYQKKGLGKKLFLFIKRKLNELGARRIFLWCFEENKNKNFYLKLNGRIVNQQIVNLDNKSIREIQFVFEY